MLRGPGFLAMPGTRDCVPMNSCPPNCRWGPNWTHVERCCVPVDRPRGTCHALPGDERDPAWSCGSGVLRRCYARVVSDTLEIPIAPIWELWDLFSLRGVVVSFSRAVRSCRALTSGQSGRVKVGLTGHGAGIACHAGALQL